MEKSNIILIGMPGAGKSTIGVLLAKRYAMEFIDTDVVLQHQSGRILQEIIDTEGIDHFRRIEEEMLCNLTLVSTIIATGGSAVYYHRSMDHLRKKGITVYLHVDAGALLARLHNIGSRGIVRRPGQSFDELFQERCQLYSHYADITVECTGLDHESCLERVCNLIDRWFNDSLK